MITDVLYSVNMYVLFVCVKTSSFKPLPKYLSVQFLIHAGKSVLGKSYRRRFTLLPCSCDVCSADELPLLFYAFFGRI